MNFGQATLAAILAATASASAPIFQINDGQVQAPNATTSVACAAITQIGDGQIQAPHVTCITSYLASATTTPTTAPIPLQTSPEQPGGPAAVVSNGTYIGPTGPPAQLSTPTVSGSAAPPACSAVISQISDGQVQAPNTVPATSQSAAKANPASSTPNAVATTLQPSSVANPFNGSASSTQYSPPQFTGGSTIVTGAKSALVAAFTLLYYFL